MNDQLDKLLANVQLFEGENLDQVLEHVKDFPILSYSPGDFILRNGEYDENCCVLMAGKARVKIPTVEGENGDTQYIQEGDFFGEISAMFGVPRTADIIAEEPCAVMEIPKEKMFEMMDDFHSMKAKMDTTYKERILNNQLRRVPLFSGLPSYMIEKLKDKATIEIYKKGDIIFDQGDPADAFYLVLFGFVKIGRTKGNKALTLAYLKGEQYFGEFGLVSGKEKRTATVSAINRTHVIRIARVDFVELMEAFPSVREALKDAGEMRKGQGAKIAEDTFLADTLEATIDSGIIQTRFVNLLDTTKCVQCDICVDACAALHDGAPRLARRGARLNGFLMAATSCRHCEDPACMYKCPTGAISRDSTGEIYHKSFCIGCGTCVRNCPYGSLSLVDIEPPKKPTLTKKLFSIFTSDENVDDENKTEEQNVGANESGLKIKGRLPKAKKKVVKCDMCNDYEFLGCVYNCPTGAMMLVKPSDFFSELLPTELG